METNGNQLITNTTKDTHENHNEDIDYSNELNFSLLQTSSQTGSESMTTVLDKTDYSTGQNAYADNDFDLIEIQNRMNDVIHDIHSQSNNNNHDQMNNSTPVIDPSTQTGPVRSMSESALIDHPTSTEPLLPIQHDENSLDNEDLYGIHPAPTHISAPTNDSIEQYQSDQENHKNNLFNDDDDEFYSTKTGTIDDKKKPPPSLTRSDSLDEERTGTSSPKLSNDANVDPQEIERVTVATLNRPRTPTPDDSHELSIPLIQDNDYAKHSQINHHDITSPALDNANTDLSNDSQQDEERLRKHSDHEINPSLSSNETTNKKDEQQTSQSNSSHGNHLRIVEEPSKLFRRGEQLRIPTKGFNKERINSPPPLPSIGVKSILLLNPLLGSHFIKEEQEKSGSLSETSRKSSTTSTISNEKLIDGEVLFPKSRRGSNLNQLTSDTIDQKSTNQAKSSISDQESLDNQEDTLREQNFSNRKGSAISNQQISSSRENLSHERQISSRQESHTSEQKILSQKSSSIEQQRTPSRRASENHVNSSSSSHQSKRSPPDLTNKNDQHDKYNSDVSKKDFPSSDIDTSNRTPSKHILPIDQQRRSSSTTDKDNQDRSSLHRRSTQKSKQNSKLITDETVVTPIIVDPSKSRQHNGKRPSTTESDFERKSTSKLPSVNSSFPQEKSRRSKIKQGSSSHPATPSDDELSSNIDHTPTTKNQSATDKHKRKEQQRLLRHSHSANSSPQIRLVDDHSLGSTSENNTDFERHNRHTIKSKKKDLQTNTVQTVNSSQQQNNIVDEQKLRSQKPLKATKPMSDHLDVTRRRALNKEPQSTTADENKPVVQCTVKQPKDSNQDKDPINVNITIVVNKATTDENSRRTTATFIKQKGQPYSDYPQRLSSTKKKRKSNERSKSTEQKRRKSHEHNDRQTQSDSEHIIAKKQKPHHRRKRISRTYQTNECTFRPIGRSRAISNIEKPIQTLRSRKQSPKKLFSPYLSVNPIRIQEISRKQYYQSRQHLSKSSSLPRNLSSQNGKLLVLRPTLPFHHTNAVNVQRICLQYAIDLIPHRTSAAHHRHKPTVQKQSKQKNTLPVVNTTSVNSSKKKSNTKEKPIPNKTSEHVDQPKTD